MHIIKITLYVVLAFVLILVLTFLPVLDPTLLCAPSDPEQLLAMQAMIPDEEAMMNLAIALSLVRIHQ